LSSKKRKRAEMGEKEPGEKRRKKEPKAREEKRPLEGKVFCLKEEKGEKKRRKKKGSNVGCTGRDACIARLKGRRTLQE